jgi:hypothetical protein|tara:strand:+ start:238 stop:516 length:279 start_codon:yes stop_codon:yes gene_type:complete
MTNLLKRFFYLRSSVITTLFCFVFAHGAYAEVQILEKYSSKITPNDVYATLDLLDRSLDTLIEARQVKQPPPIQLGETDLRPMHVYQLACRQ